MSSYHVKSPCCGTKIIRFGKRRKQCVLCHKTWRVRKKKVGRKSKRETSALAIKYLNHQVLPLYSQAKIRKVTQRRLQLRLRKSLKTLLSQKNWLEIPKDKNLIAIADAMMVDINKVTYTFYFILLREISSNQAIITKPYLTKEAESGQGWYKAFHKLPQRARLNIVALVCDGQRGLISLAKTHHWLLQRCNFHLLAAIQGRRSKWVNSRHQTEGAILYKLANRVLTTCDENIAREAVREIRVFAKATKSAVLRKVLNGFSSNYEDFRTYLKYPELNLPRTSNTAESLVSMVRELCHRARGFRTRQSLLIWTQALIKERKIIICNGSLPTKFRY